MAGTKAKFGCFLSLGIMIVFIGFVMTMYGYLHKPFWSNSSESWCDFCNDNIERDRQNIKNTRIVGPIFLCLGIVVTIVAVFYRRSQIKSHVNQGINATASHGGAVVGYSSVGESAPGQPPYQQPPAYQPTNNTYPPQQYPPQQYPPQQQTYPSQAQPYPAAQTQYPVGPTPYPPPQAGLQGTPYPPPSGAYPQQQAAPIPAKSDYPAPPSYNEATMPSAPPS